MKKNRSATWIALLRGVNVSGRNRVPMAELRALGEEQGWENVQTYIQSGNLIFTAPGTANGLEKKLGEMIKTAFGVSVPVLVRSAEDWPDLIGSNPFPEASKSEPNLVMLCLAQSALKAGAAELLRERAAESERIVPKNGLWIHFGGGVARSKLTPAVLDRAAGSSVTARNWRTVLKLGEMAAPAKA